MSKPMKTISIAMQGGGAHGAFTWGVLDRILEDGRIAIEGVTGTSAGGMNAVATVQGLIKGGNQGARDSLLNFWSKISESGRNSPLNNRGIIDKAMKQFTMYNSPGFIVFDFLSRLFSPYELNPLGFDPLRKVIEELFDFNLLRQCEDYKLYLCATHVSTGKLKLFESHELSTETLLATACLPTIHSAVKVNGQYYWDGGFIGNPVFFPLIYNCQSPDILFIQLNPTHREELPITARAISDRLNEVTNNATVSRELRAIRFIGDLIDKGELDKNKHKRVYMHRILDEDTFKDFGWSSKLNTEWEMINFLFEKGRMAATNWLKDNFDKIGQQDTFEIDEELYLPINHSHAKHPKNLKGK